MNEVAFNIPTCPFESNKQKLFVKRPLIIQPGLTTLVGCNGSGKTTLLYILSDMIKKRENATVIKYDDRHDGGHNLIERMMLFGDSENAMAMMVSSEGERIYKGVGQIIGKISRSIRKDKPKEIWVMMDAIGSGLSIDYIRDVKDIVPFIQEDNPDILFYFIVSTNEYEFTIGSNNIDVTTFKPIAFKTYNDYAKFIMKTREKKDKRNW